MGAPVGNKNASKAKTWADAIRRALAQTDPRKQRKKLDMVAEALVASALDGDVAAMKEIGDRLDGKPAATLANPDGESFRVEVTQTIVDAG